MKIVFCKQAILLLVLAICRSTVYGQVKLSGTVKDTASHPVSSVSITLAKKNTNLIVAFAITDNAGQFSLQYNGNINDTFYLQANAIGLAGQMKMVTAPNQYFKFILQYANTVLPTVTVKNTKPFLKLRGDTISYTIDSFKNTQDRTIGDVLKKLPGIDVDANGKISYNGKAISNFYIDGDNLLDDKYNLATNSIAADMVDKVQILENHQPIKVLKDATISDKVALNLSLKDKARLKLTGHAELGAGISDEEIYDETINVMAFKKRYKAINSLKANNSGTDISDDIISHNLSDYLRQIENDNPNSLLSMSTSGNPAIGKQRYLFNNAAIINTNNLFKTRNDLQLKANIYYLNDCQPQDFQSTTIYYLPGDTIRYSVQQHNETKFALLHAQLNINDNKPSHYLNNTMVMNINDQPGQSGLNTNGNKLTQSLSEKTNSFSNELNLIVTSHKKNIIETYSYFNYMAKPEILKIEPGMNEAVFNNNTPFVSLIQSANTPTYFTNNYISYRHPSKHILQAYKIGMTGQWQQLQSSLSVIQLNNSSTAASDSFTNHLHWQHYKIYSQADCDWITNRTQLSLSLPYNWLSINYQDTILRQSNSLNRFSFNPTLRFKYQTGQENFITAGYIYSNRIGTIEDIYPGYILNNFRTVSANSIPFLQSNSQNIILGFNFRKTIKIFFFNLLASYSVTNNNSISTTIFLSNLQKSTILPFNNTTNSFRLSSGMSKYLFAIHATLSVRASLEKTKWNQLQNTILLNYLNSNESVAIGLNSKISSWLNASYNAAFGYSKSENINAPQNSSGQGQSTNQVQQQIEINVLPSSNFFIKLKSENFYTKQNQLNTTNCFFGDASFLYKINPIKADVSLTIDNIADTKQFSNISLSANNLSQSIYTIRPRMFLVKFFFNF